MCLEVINVQMITKSTRRGKAPRNCAETVYSKEHTTGEHPTFKVQAHTREYMKEPKKEQPLQIEEESAKSSITETSDKEVGQG